jgi:hypothetical protein
MTLIVMRKKKIKKKSQNKKINKNKIAKIKIKNHLMKIKNKMINTILLIIKIKEMRKEEELLVKL